ncbi:hypothetical protein D8B26_007235 [Coccidioides posadasii str. Silveira]|nr:hypothetical protein D8B26_007235 [Coccidioides posadasii str. Silveira]
MASFSEDDRNTIKKYPLNHSLDQLQDLLQDTEDSYTPHLISDDGALDGLDEASSGYASTMMAPIKGEK